MTREEAKEELIQSLTDNHIPDPEAVEMAINALGTEPRDDATLKDIFCMGCEYKEQEPCYDAVSKQAVLDKKELVELEDGQSFYCISPEDVETLPPVTPQMMNQWQELKETITEMRDNDGTGTQQEACKFLANLMDVLEKQMSGSDCISRQELLNNLEKPMNWTDSEAEVQEQRDYESFVSLVESMPSVTPRAKTGHWIYVDECHEHGRCSECGYGSVDLVGGELWNFCPNCGSYNGGD